MIFKVEIEKTIVCCTVEVSKDLLMWMDLGGTRDSKNRIDDTSADRATKIFKFFAEIDGIEKDSIEYNGHFGPFVYFSCDQSKFELISKQIIDIVKNCQRKMLRSVAYKQKDKIRRMGK